MTFLPPWLLRFRFQAVHGPRFSLWLPLFIIWPILLLLFLIVGPLVLLALWAAYFFFSCRINPFTLFFEFYLLMCGLRGLRVDVQEPRKQSVVQIEFR